VESNIIITKPAQASLGELASQINVAHGEFEAAFRRGLISACRAGQLLAEVKKRLAHGSYSEWVSVNCKIAPRTAQKYMKLAENWTKLIEKGIEGMSINGAIAFLDDSDELNAPDRAHLTDGHPKWDFKANRNYIGEFLVDGVPWTIVIVFEVENNGIAYFNSVFHQWIDDPAKHDATASCRASVASSQYRILTRHFPAAIVGAIEWKENAEDWRFKTVHCWKCGGNGHGDLGRDPKTKCDRCGGAQVLPREPAAA